MIDLKAKSKKKLKKDNYLGVLTLLLKNRISKSPENWFILPFYISIMPFFIIGSLVIHLPLLLYISFYSLTISSITLLYDNKILNSLTIPLTFTYLSVSIQDIMNFNFLFSLFHVPTVISCLIIIQRKDHNLPFMLLFSSLYALWVYFIKETLNFPFYNQVFGIRGAFNQALIVFIIGSLTSIIVSIAKYIKNKQKKINDLKKINKKEISF
jgi:hypothetical protein